MATTMAYADMGSCRVVVHTEEDPSNEEWDGWLRSLAAVGGFDCCVVVSDGGGPNPKQRKALHECMHRLGCLQIPVAVVTGARMTRGVITALSWLGQNIRAFPPSGVAEAYAFIGRSSQAVELDRLIAKLKGQLGLAS